MAGVRHCSSEQDAAEALLGAASTSSSHRPRRKCTSACTCPGSLTDAQGGLPQAAAYGLLSEAGQAQKHQGLHVRRFRVVARWARSRVRFASRRSVAPATHTPHVMWQPVTQNSARLQCIVAPLHAVHFCAVSTPCHATLQGSVSSGQRTEQMYCTCSAHAAATARRARLTAQQQSVLRCRRAPSGALMLCGLSVSVVFFLGRAF